MDELLEARAVLAARRALADQRRVRREDHALLHLVVDARRDLGVLELQVARATNKNGLTKLQPVPSKRMTVKRMVPFINANV